MGQKFQKVAQSFEKVKIFVLLTQINLFYLSNIRTLFKYGKESAHLLFN